jgi:hypothetical protein
MYMKEGKARWEEAKAVGKDNSSYKYHLPLAQHIRYLRDDYVADKNEQWESWRRSLNYIDGIL